MSLKELRSQLDSIDAELIELLARRDDVVREIWAWKKENGVEMIDPAREAELRQRVLGHAVKLGLKPEAVTAILQQIVGRRLR